MSLIPSGELKAGNHQLYDLGVHGVSMSLIPSGELKGATLHLGHGAGSGYQ